MILDEARDFVAAAEGLRLEPYQDEAGLWTVGYGHRCERFQRRLSKDEAGAILRDDLQVAAAEIEALGLALSAGQQVALISFIFNIGVGAWRASTLRLKVLAGDFYGAANEFDRWTHVRRGGAMVTSNGLQARRARERKLFEGSAMGGSAVSNVVMDRLKEPSTWRGLGGLLVALGLASAGSVDAVVAVGAALLSVVEVVRRESK